MNYFTLPDHKRIEKLIRDKVKCNWIITYDNAPDILKIYNNYNVKQYDLNYSVSQKRLASELIIFPSNVNCPINKELEEKNIYINLR